MSNGKPLKVLSIAHPAVRRHIGRLRYHPFARDPDVDVHLVVPSSWHEYGRTTAADPGDDAGVTLHIEPIMLRYLPGIKWYAHFYKELGRIVQEVQPDVIHLWEEPWSVVALQAARLKGNAALVLEVDQNLIKKLPPPFEWIRRSVLNRTDLILSRSGEATAVVRAFGFAGPVRSIGYGVDQEMFSPAPSVAKRSEAGLRVGYVGRLVVEKGLDEALNAMVACHLPVSLAIKGEGPYADPLRSRVKELGLEDRVSMVGWGDAKDTAAFFRSLDVSLLLSRSSPVWREQFGRTIIESQSCGVPVIGADSGAIPDVIGDGGWVVPERDVDALAELFDQLATAPEELAEKRALGLANVASRFTFQITAKILAKAWKEAYVRCVTLASQPDTPARQAHLMRH